MVVLGQQGDGTPVRVLARAKGERIGALRMGWVAQQPQREHGALVYVVEIVFWQIERERQQLHQPQGQLPHGGDVAAALGGQLRQCLRPLVATVGVVAALYIRMVCRVVWGLFTLFFPDALRCPRAMRKAPNEAGVRPQ